MGQWMHGVNPPALHLCCPALPQPPRAWHRGRGAASCPKGWGWQSPGCWGDALQLLQAELLPRGSVLGKAVRSQFHTPRAMRVFWERGSHPSTPLCLQAPLEESYGEKARKSSSTPQLAKRPPAAPSRPPAPGAGTSPASHTLPKAGAGSLFNSLQRRERAKAEQARLLTLQGIMGSSSLQPSPEERRGPTNTWPLKCGRRKAAGAAPSPPLGELLLYVKNPLVRDIDAECGATPGHPQPRCVSPGSKPACPQLALGSVLSLELPKDLGCLRDAAPREEERQGAGVRLWQPGCETGRQEEGTGGQSRDLGKAPKGERGTWFEEVSFNPSYGRHKAWGLEEHRSPRQASSAGEGIVDSRPSRPPHVSSRERDALATRSYRDGSPGSGAGRHEAARPELGPSPAGTSGEAGAVPSAACASPAAPTQLSVFEWELGPPQPPSPVLGTDVCRPARGQFEEEEEELQAIWDGASEWRAPSRTAGSPPGSDTAGRPLILSAANNVLVAKFTLPGAAQLLHSPHGEKSHGATPCLEEPPSTAPSDSPGTWDRHRQREEEREGSKVSAGLGVCPGLSQRRFTKRCSALLCSACRLPPGKWSSR